jgi:predicted AlkP superfamily pyrophosphatase or phosphodiesterase
MKKILIITLLNCLITTLSFSQEKPKLVVGIVVDQMRYDYIYRFWDDFSDDGFKKLINEGYFFRNAQFGYVPTFTGPGHASIYTGTTPSVHGIIANDWYDKTNGKSLYCSQDDEMTTIGDTSSAGKMSPHNMLTSTFSDELKLFNDGKVIGVSLKDRGAILPAGHSGDAAYWMDENGNWISSSYYMTTLPEWLQAENEKDKVIKYMSGIWKVKNEFTHNLDTLIKINGRGAIKKTPFGNTILNDLAIRILKEEKLGKNKTTDCLFVSYSSTDYIGHQYGPHAPELVDTYIRLDKDIAQLLKSIDNKVGFENAVLFLTADHGVVSEPKELLERKIPAGYFESAVMINGLKLHLNTAFGEGEWVKNYSNHQLFLNHTLITEKGLELEKVQQICAHFLLNIDGVKNTFTAKQMHDNEYQNSFHSLIQRGYNQKRSGDVMVALQTGWISKYWENGGTTHGSSYSYDTHVPLIFWGGNIKQGTTDRKVNIRDIAPSISTILGTAYPNGCTGNPLVEITK